MRFHLDTMIDRLFADRTRYAARAAPTAPPATPMPDPAESPVAVPDPTPAGATDNVSPNGGMLFVQSYRSGHVTADPEATGGHRVTLEGGLGQTLFFTDRPARDVGMVPQLDFLSRFPFADDNPPNAAMVMERPDGETEFAIVELRNPTVEITSGTVTYDIQGLADWRHGITGGLTEAPTDLSTIASEFGATHLFIDDCPDGRVVCNRRQQDANNQTTIRSFAFTWQGMCFSLASLSCVPCYPFYHSEPEFKAAYNYWTRICQVTFSGFCQGGGGYCYADSGEDHAFQRFPNQGQQTWGFNDQSITWSLDCSVLDCP